MRAVIKLTVSVPDENVDIDAECEHGFRACS